MPEKTCPKCGQAYPLTDFYNDKSREAGRYVYCKHCCKAYQGSLDRADYMRAYQGEHREHLNELARKRDAKRRETNPEPRRQYWKEYLQGLKAQVFTAYGNKCYCCGFDDVRFLTVDHVHGGGGKHRKEGKSGAAFIYRYAIKNNFPDTLRLACWNCNGASGRRGGTGLCFHEEDRLKARMA
ncbi:MAG TPA: hypothetical protein VD948_06065 [Rhodothermales bacterium]|nr:hypothetical protein [Rhodothermales bacterium]